MNKLSKDFEIANTSNKFKLTNVKHFLKLLDDRQSELNLDYERARQAARLFKMGDFEGALKKIWGSTRVKKDIEIEGDGNFITNRYIVRGWGAFLEKISWLRPSKYIHTIQATYEDNPNPTFDLASVLYVEERKPAAATTREFEQIIDNSNSKAFKEVPTALIYNILFVGYGGTGISVPLNKNYLRLIKKL